MASIARIQCPLCALLGAREAFHASRCSMIACGSSKLRPLIRYLPGSVRGWVRTWGSGAAARPPTTMVLDTIKRWVNTALRRERAGHAGGGDGGDVHGEDVEGVGRFKVPCTDAELVEEAIRSRLPEKSTMDILVDTSADSAVLWENNDGLGGTQGLRKHWTGHFLDEDGDVIDEVFVAVAGGLFDRLPIDHDPDPVDGLGKRARL